MEKFIQKALQGKWREDLTYEFIQSNFDINQRKACFLDSDFWHGLATAFQWDKFELEVHHRNFFSELLHANWSTAMKYLEDVTAHKN